jgi:hypothetical protein
MDAPFTWILTPPFTCFLFLNFTVFVRCLGFLWNSRICDVRFENAYTLHVLLDSTRLAPICHGYIGHDTTRHETAAGGQQPLVSSSSTPHYDPFTRSRTLFFLSIRDSRPRRRHHPPRGVSGRAITSTSTTPARVNAAADAFVIYDEDDEEDNNSNAENARLLGTTTTPNAASKKTTTGGHVVLEVDEPGLPPAW